MPMSILTPEQLEHLDKIASSSGVFIGFLGGFVKAVTSGKGIVDGICKMIVGSIVAWLSAPFVRVHCPDEAYPMVVFLFGYGGTEVVTFLQTLCQNVIAGKFEHLLSRIFSKGEKMELPHDGIKAKESA